ncbi:MAG: MarC family protein [Ignavibacteriales bacterium]|nr:MarC family protein [Ignavibacteriales bacterium]
MKKLLLSFIPLFVAIDIIGTVPIYLGLTEDLSEKEKKKLLFEAILAAFVIALVFLVGGKIILRFIGITIDDFRIAGGIILLILSISDILFTSEERKKSTNKIGIVPLGIPLIIGPAALTTILILLDQYGFINTVISMVVNFTIVWFVMYYAQIVIKLIGDGGTKAFAKIASLFLAAIAIMMIRVGISNVVKAFR